MSGGLAARAGLPRFGRTAWEDYNMTLMRLLILSLLSISLAVQMTPAGIATAQDAMPAVPTTEAFATPRLAWFYKPPQNGNLAPLVENFSTFILTVNDEGV